MMGAELHIPGLGFIGIALVIVAEWQIGKRCPKYSGAAIVTAFMLPAVVLAIGYGITLWKWLF